LDVRIEDSLPKGIEYEDINDILAENFTEAEAASSYVGGRNKCYAVLFGRCENGESISIRVEGFRPSLFFRKADFVNKNQLINEIVEEVNNNEGDKQWMKKRFSDFTVTDLNVKHSYGFEPNETETDRKSFNYFKIEFPTRRSWQHISKKDNTSDISGKAHEKNVECITRFFNEAGISPGWIKINGVRTYEKITSSRVEVECGIQDISPVLKTGIAPIKIGYYDIETLGLEYETYPICTIGVTVRVFGGAREEYVLQIGQCDDIPGKIVIICQNEQDILNKFRDFIIDHDLDALVSYNGTNFDEEFIYERAKLMKANRFFYCSRYLFKKCFKKKIPLSSAGMGDNELTIFDTAGILHLDWYIKFKIEDKEPSYKLDYFGKKYCGTGKDPVKYWEIPDLANGTPTQRARLAKYCGLDCDLLDDLERKRNILSDLFNLSSVCLILPQWVYFKGQQVRYISQLLHKARKKNMILNIPTEGWSGNADSKYEGAIVFDPIVDYYDKEPVSVLDYASLYPSIIMSHNYSPDTLVQKEEFKSLEGVEEHTISNKGETYHFTTKVKGLLPEMLEDLMTARKETKKELKVAQQKLESATTDEEKEMLELEVANLDGKQKAQKISANSLYGAMGAFSTGTYICLAAAEATTNMARIMLVDTKDFLESNYDCTVVYGDTDSCMVKFNGVTDLQESGKLAKNAALKMTQDYAAKGYPKKVLEFEDTLFPTIFLAKKRYIGFMYVEGKDGTMIPKGVYCKGVETERRDFCKYAKDVFANLIDGLIIKRDLQGALKQFDRDMMDLIEKKVPFESFILNKSLSKNYVNPAVQPHLQVNEKRKKRNPGSEYSVGSRVDYVIIEGPPKSKLADLAEDPEYVLEKNLNVDAEWYCEHQVKEPVTRILAPIKNVPSNLFQRYLGELKRIRLNISTLESFQGFSEQEEVICDASKFLKTSKLKKDPVKVETKKTKQSSLFDYGEIPTTAESIIKFPKRWSTEPGKPSKKPKK
jgi:DNA polymerase delta subunit 1